jgi:hypothetical protein
MKLFRFVIIPILLFIPLLAFGQVGTASTSSVAVGLGDLLEGGKAVYTAFDTVGVMAGLIATVNLLINATKFGPIGAAIKKAGLKWIRPLLAVVLGGLGGAAVSLSTGQVWWQALIAGLIAGMAAPGLHEVIELLRGKRKPEPEAKAEA